MPNPVYSEAGASSSRSEEGSEGVEVVGESPQIERYKSYNPWRIVRSVDATNRQPKGATASQHCQYVVDQDQYVFGLRFVVMVFISHGVGYPLVLTAKSFLPMKFVGLAGLGEEKKPERLSLKRCVVAHLILKYRLKPSWCSYFEATLEYLSAPDVEIDVVRRIHVFHITIPECMCSDLFIDGLCPAHARMDTAIQQSMMQGPSGYVTARLLVYVREEMRENGVNL